MVKMYRKRVFLVQARSALSFLALLPYPHMPQSVPESMFHSCAFLWVLLQLISMLVGYARVSTDDQTLDPQTDALTKVGCQKIFTDIASGAKTDRAGLREAIDFLRDGDTLVVWKL